MLKHFNATDPTLTLLLLIWAVWNILIVSFRAEEDHWEREAFYFKSNPKYTRSATAAQSLNNNTRRNTVTVCCVGPKTFTLKSGPCFLWGWRTSKLSSWSKSTEPKLFISCNRNESLLSGQQEVEERRTETLWGPIRDETQLMKWGTGDTNETSEEIKTNDYKDKTGSNEALKQEAPKQGPCLVGFSITPPIGRWYHSTEATAAINEQIQQWFHFIWLVIWFIG